MIQTVVKRDGRIVGFNEQKIMAAIRKAMLHTDKGEDSSLIEQITDHIAYRGKSQMSVEAIQDAIELELMKSARKDVAQKYIAYRNQRNIARKAKTRDVFMSIVNAKNNDITRENANMNADTPAGMMMKFASETTKPFVDDYLLSQEVRDAVTHNYIHIHDKDYYPTKSLTCVQHPLDVILSMDSLQAMALAVQLSVLKPQPYWHASLWRLVKTRCMEVRLFLPLTSIWHHMYVCRIRKR